MRTVHNLVMCGGFFHHDGIRQNAVDLVQQVIKNLWKVLPYSTNSTELVPPDLAEWFCMWYLQLHVSNKSLCSHFDCTSFQRKVMQGIPCMDMTTHNVCLFQKVVLSKREMIRWLSKLTVHLLCTSAKQVIRSLFIGAQSSYEIFLHYQVSLCWGRAPWWWWWYICTLLASSNHGEQGIRHSSTL